MTLVALVYVSFTVVLCTCTTRTNRKKRDPALPQEEENFSYFFLSRPFSFLPFASSTTSGLEGGFKFFPGRYYSTY